ncbi:MAG: hypothetical protein HY909_03155 [Deltaproteobacteria bacterium]|nr:hypothetical protein [Deltaproteobacteria bacterium]
MEPHTVSDEPDLKVRPRPETQDPRCWRAEGWTARVVKNLDDDGWAVEMLRDGESEPALVGPWTMGRDKKNPKPLDQSAFATLVKTATEVLQRHAQQRRAQLHRSVTVHSSAGESVRVDLDITPDDDDPHAELTAWDRFDQCLARRRVAPSFKLTATTASRWVDEGLPTASLG